MSDYLLRRPGPAGPEGATEVWIPVDSGTPEGQALIEANRGTPDLIRIDSETEQAIAREQATARRQDILNEVVPQPIQEALSAGVGGVNEMTFGLPSLIERNVNPSGAITTEALTRNAPGGNIAGRIGGGVAPAILTGGETTALSAFLRATPAGLSEMAGNAAFRALSNQLIARGVAPGLARTLGYAGAGVTDATVGGILQELTDSNIEGRAVEGERMVANVGIGLPLGLSVGALGGVGELARSRLMRAADAAQLVDNGMGSANVSTLANRTPLPEEQGLLMDFATSRLNGLNPEQSRHVRMIAADRRAFLERELIAESRQGAVDISNVLTQNLAEVRQLDGLEFRQQTLLRNLDDADPNAAVGHLTGLQAQADRLEQVAARRGADSARLDEIRRLIPSESALFEVDGVGSTARELDRSLQAIRNGRLLEGISDADSLRLAQETETMMRSALGRLGTGGARAAAVHHLLGNLDASVREMQPRFGRPSIRTGDLEVDEGKLFSGTSDSYYQVRTDTTKYLGRVLEDLRALNSKMDEIGAGGRGAELTAEVDRIDNRVANLQDWATLVAVRRGLEDAAANNAGVRAALSGARFALTGAVLGGPGGAIAGGLLDTTLGLAQNPIGLIRLRNSLRGAGNAQQAFSTRLTAGVGRLRAALQGIEVTPAVRSVRRIPSQLAAGVSRANAYNAIVAQVNELATNPEALQEQLEETVGDVSGQVHPAVGGAVTMSLVNAVYYLQALVPPASLPSPFDHVKPKRNPSQTEMRSYLRRVEVLEDPLLLLDLAAMSQLSSEHVEAVQAVYPEVLNEIKAEVTAMLGDLAKPPKYKHRIQLGYLLGITTDPSLEGSFMFSLQQTYSQTPEQQRQQVSPRGAQGMNRAARNTYSETQELSLTF